MTERPEDMYCCWLDELPNGARPSHIWAVEHEFGSVLLHITYEKTRPDQDLYKIVETDKYMAFLVKETVFVEPDFAIFEATMNLRFVRRKKDVGDQTILLKILQQGWLNTKTGEVDWRDVPEIEA